MSSQAVVNLNNGQSIPTLGLGTWQSPENEVKQAVHLALEAGYRHIDTAYQYMNEAAIGDVIQDWIKSGKLKREELFITTKLPFIGNHVDKVEHFLKLSLQNLKLDYVDLYLIHFPVGFVGNKDDKDLFPKDENGMSLLDMNTDHVSLWKAMETQVDAGRAKSIGLSNFNSEQVTKIVESARIKPVNLQVELSLYFQQKQLRDFCKTHDITICAYGPLGSSGRAEFYAKRGATSIPDIPTVLQDTIVMEIARAHSKTPAQVLLRHLIQQGVIVIPKSVTERRIKENFQIFDFVLSACEMELLNRLDQNRRSFKFTEMFNGMAQHPDYPFRIPF